MRMKMLLGFLVLTLIAAPLFAVACAGENGPPDEEENGETILIRCTTHLAEVGSIAMMRELETTIPQATNGRVEFELYPAEQLYGYVEGYTAVQKGDIEMCVGGTDSGCVIPEWDVFSAIPFFIEDEAHLFRFFETDEWKAFLDRMADNGFTQIALLGGTGTGNLFNNKHPVETMEDLADVRYWFPPLPMFLEAANALGIQTVALDFAEYTTALETGLVDGCVSTDTCLEAWQLAETCPYMTVTNFGFTMDTLLVNTTFWNNLPSDIRETLEQVFADFEEEALAATRAKHEQLLAEFEATPGTVISEITGAEKDRWIEAMEPVYALALEIPYVEELLEAARSVE